MSMDKKDRKKLRNYWKPENVNVLFIGESPPDDENAYFYNHNYENKKGMPLFRRITDAFIDTKLDSKEEKLKILKKSGFWLVDFFQEPMKEQKEKPSWNQIEKYVKEFLSEVSEEVKPEYFVFLIPGFKKEKMLWKYILANLITEKLQNKMILHPKIIVIERWKELNKDSEELKPLRNLIRNE